MAKPASLSRWYSRFRVSASYSEWPVMKICRPLSVAMAYTPAWGEEARIFSRGTASTSSRRMEVWRE